VTFYAHSHHSQPAPGDRWQLMSSHLQNVAALAVSNAKGICSSNEAFAASVQLAALLHDLGKYRPEFQQKLRGIPVSRERTYHKQAGGAKAWDLQDFPAAFAIIGHHGGLPNRAAVQDAVSSPCGKDVADAVWHLAAAEVPALASLTRCHPSEMSLTVEVWTRMLFSCLVDADWTDTGNHERQASGLSEEPAAARFEPDIWLDRLLQTVKAKSETCSQPRVKLARQAVLDACLIAAAQPPGLFSLTVPTGGGKTLAGLAFALKHAMAHNLRRIIYVAPYLTILEQNEGAIRTSLQLTSDSPALFAHHSLADPASAADADEPFTDVSLRRSENWDAPIIVTTSVQFFESLFSNRTSRCRKLHNIPRSVVILDECQSLPPDVVGPTCSMLRQLATEWRTTILLCTATQPAFDHQLLRDDERLRATEIIPDAAALFQQLKRVTLKWPAAPDHTITWDELAAQMKSVSSDLARNGRTSPSALTIVNSRRAARELFKVLRESGEDEVFHLSTSMCPAHRSEVLTTVRNKLRERQRCFLVSTQLIEAGVDLDFPVVFREVAPLESIIQAAGRCNREGTLNEELGMQGGKVIVFRSAAALAEPQKYYPQDKWYKSGRSTLENNFLNAGRQPQIDSPTEIHEYFTRLYCSGSLDRHKIQDLRRRFSFVDVAETYRLINENGTTAVVATWEPRVAMVQSLLQAVSRDPSRANFRALAPYQINLKTPDLLKQSAFIAPISDRIQSLVWYGGYDNNFGFNPEQADALLLV
jgi:CRISPR-associated endonuclease/helicase Cas3